MVGILPKVMTLTFSLKLIFFSVLCDETKKTHSEIMNIRSFGCIHLFNSERGIRNTNRENRELVISVCIHNQKAGVCVFVCVFFSGILSFQIFESIFTSLILKCRIDFMYVGS